MHALISYISSAYIFFWAYHFQISNLTLTTVIPTSYGQAVLNERFTYYYLFLPVTLGIIAAGLHVALDIDRVHFDDENFDFQPKDRIFASSKKLLQKTLVFSVASVVLLPVFYFIARPFFWTILVTLVRTFIKLHPAKSWAYTGLPINFGLLSNTFLFTFLLSFGWAFANMAFGVYMSMSPVFRGEYLTNKSSDKNGTLIDGLKHHEKQLGCMLAYLELVKIASQSESRRKLLFEDIESRPTAWYRLKKELFATLDDVTERLKKKTKKSQGSQKTDQQAAEALRLKQQENETAGLITIKATNVFAKAARGQTHLIESIQDKEAKSSAKVVSLVDMITVKIRKFVMTYPKVLEVVTRSKYGYPFRFTLERQVHRLLPNPLLTSAGICSLGKLVIHSRSEDRYGVVQGSIPEILDKLVTTRAALNKYIEKPPKHWSDQEGKPLKKNSAATAEQKKKQAEKDKIALRDMTDVLDVVECQINDIVGTFYLNLKDLKLSKNVWEYIHERQHEQVLDGNLYMDESIQMEQLP